MMPLDEPIVATAGFVLVHVPPVVRSLSVAGVPVHTVVGPVIGDTRLMALIVVVAAQPDGRV